MHLLLPWLALSLAGLGNCGFWLFCFNRVNAFGYPRPVAKLLEKVCIALCFSIPLVVAWYDWPALRSWWEIGGAWPVESAPLLKFWLCWNWLSLLLLGPLWLESRRWLWPPAHLQDSESQLFDVHRLLPEGSAADRPTIWWSRLPLNQWAHLEVTRKSLSLPRSVPTAHGLTIGHLSDLHFTGQYRLDHYRFALERFMELQPELIVISGDIIDFEHCLPSVESALSLLNAPLGVHFVLGNHDRRLRDIQPLLSLLRDLGFHDLGHTRQLVKRADLSVLLSGNEAPWFHRHVEPLEDDPAGLARDNAVLRLGVAHTPDRIGWARRHRLDLLLCGHTHGGQARFPGIGPIVAPSLYGSKFASGVFWAPPTLMHVSRGLAGTHTIRLRCPPEVTLLTLLSPPDPAAAG